jgi:xanthine dehydrogenase iron-sulfur cluster and FAD-binding subunit A
MHESNLDPMKSREPRDHLVIYLNGKRCVVNGECGSLTLADWLRQKQGKVGTKIVCNEGDCGACSVLLGKVDASGAKIQYRAIDSCIAFLFQLDRTHVVTVEGLSVDGMLSPIQEAMVKCHGSQCGFCTPGFVTTMHAMVETSQPLDDASLRYSLSGNLCRCTGYLQILQAGKSIDSGNVATLSALYPDEPLIRDFAAMDDIAIRMSTATHTIFVPSTIDEAIRFRTENRQATIVSGATDYGVLHNHGRAKSNDLLCLSGVRGLNEIAVKEGTLVIGALATWIDIERAVKTMLPQDNERLKLYKISKRCDMDISTLTFAIWANVDGQRIREARIAVGGVGPTVMRMKKSEQSMGGKPWSEETFRSVGQIAKDEISPWTDVRGSAAYRLALTENLLVKCFHDFSE